MRKTTYYGSRISDNLTRTPEGFLICRNVRIARTGKQEYMGREMGLEDDRLHIVARDAAEVFSPAAMASFEGKPFTDEHPPDGVTPDNATGYTKGTVQNVRRGAGEDSDFLLADIVVYDAQTIHAIEDGKREISCGYECVYEEDGAGGYRQAGIVGNHVALVQRGRAGEKVAIQDEKTKGGVRHMPKTKKSFWGNLIGLVKDNSPEDLETAVDEMLKSCADDGEELTEAAAAPAAPAEERPENPVADDLPGETGLEARLARVEAMLTKLLEAAQPKEPDALDTLEAELKGTNPATDENPDENAAEVIEAGDEAPEEEAEKTGDSLALLRTLKPAVANIKDPAERKKASDTLAKLLRGQLGVPGNTGTSAYAAIQTAAHQTADGKKEDLTELGRKWAASRNPHYKKEGK